MSIQAVIFDIGNVLIEWQPERFYDSVIGAARRKKMFAEVDLHGMNERVDLGENFRDTVMAQADATPQWHDEIVMWHDRWIEMAAPAMDHSVRLLRALRRANVPVFALSNFGIQTFAIGEREYPFLEEFDRRYISGHMGITKPSADIYKQVEDDCGLPPQSLLFADDRADNIAAADARGWQTHLFETPQKWADRLVAEGLLSPENAQ
ncbi:HAD family hydrolase [Aestuariibius sp. HNIBRBA575]|uniref:HAD family hydrolase n=1 Tax=Aestuariibius sp. HNIBRBA575 TaxID=3233343 RepID=UPI0034A0E78B